MINSPPAMNASLLSYASPASQPLILRFTWIEYVFFGLMVGSSLIVGIYFGCYRNKNASTFEYLLGSRRLQTLPAVMSLIASHASGITILGGPSDVYFYGTQYWATIFGGLILSNLTVWIYLPVFYELKLKSPYEYLKLRFGCKARTFALIIYILDTSLYLPILVYMPALVFSQVTGVSIQKTAMVVCAVCIFYTTIGGLRGVVWNDTIQFSVTLISLAVVFIMGVLSEGGFREIWQRAEKGMRIEFFNMDMDPTARSTLWGTVFGAGIFWVACIGIHPASVQRLLAVPSLDKAKLCMHVFGASVFVTTSVTSFIGVMMFARYHQCDPYSSKRITRVDQILPYYVMDIGRDIPGLSCLFLTGVFCTALSTTSTHLNTVSGIIYTDFLDVYLPGKRSDATANRMIKFIVIAFACLSMVMILLVEKLRGVLEMGISLSGMTSGPLLGLFTMGMLFPTIDSKSALIGAILSLILMAWIVVGNVISTLNGSLNYDYKPLETIGCSDMNSSTLLNHTCTIHRNESQPLWIYRISFYWYTLIGVVVSIVVGLIGSKLLPVQNRDYTTTKKSLYSPLIHGFIKDESDELEAYSLKTAEELVLS